MLQNLKDITGSPAHIRIGGTTSNHATWVADQEEAIIQNFAVPGADQPANVTLGPNYLQSFKTFPNGTLYTIGVTFDSGKAGEDATVKEAQAFYECLGDDLFAMEVGNEFDGTPILYLHESYLTDPSTSLSCQPNPTLHIPNLRTGMAQPDRRPHSPCLQQRSLEETFPSRRLRSPRHSRQRHQLQHPNRSLPRPPLNRHRTHLQHAQLLRRSLPPAQAHPRHRPHEPHRPPTHHALPRHLRRPHNRKRHTVHPRRNQQHRLPGPRRRLGRLRRSPLGNRLRAVRRRRPRRRHLLAHGHRVPLQRVAGDAKRDNGGWTAAAVLWQLVRCERAWGRG